MELGNKKAAYAFRFVERAMFVKVSTVTDALSGQDIRACSVENFCSNVSTHNTRNMLLLKENKKILKRPASLNFTVKTLWFQPFPS